MAEPAEKRWTVEEFLAWDDGTDRRHELVGGQIVAMAPPSEAHATIVINLGAELRSRLKPPCRVLAELGVRSPGREDSFYQFDLAVSSAQADPARPYVAEPELIVEVLSPSTALHDRGRKLDHYRQLPSINEILLVASEERRVQPLASRRHPLGGRRPDRRCRPTARHRRAPDPSGGDLRGQRGVSPEPAAGRYGRGSCATKSSTAAGWPDRCANHPVVEPAATSG
jgi:Uma2 family endonuclease